MPRWSLALVALFAMLAVETHACTRCGLFGRRCRFAVVDSHHVAAVAVAPVVVKQPDVFVVQNNYPQANGAALLAQQGGTVYGLQGAAQPYVLDPSAVLRQAAELTRGAQQLASQGLTGYNTTASLALSLNAPANETLAKGVAASATLQAAGLSVTSQGSSQAIRITRGADGRYVVEDVTRQLGTVPQTQATEPVQPQLPSPPDATLAGVGELVKRHCGECHGLDNPAPKGGLYFDAGHGLDCRSGLAAVKAVMSGKMPKGVQLSPEVRASLVQELASLVVPE